MSRVSETNMLGALVTALSDRTQQAVERAARRGAEDPAALVTLYWQTGLTIAELAAVLDRSHAATVRVVDRLGADGLVVRTVGGDQRSRMLRLTRQGRRRARAVLGARNRVLNDALAPLTGKQRAQLHRLLTRVLGGMTRDAREAAIICRLCDERGCPLDECPITAVVTT